MEPAPKGGGVGQRPFGVFFVGKFIQIAGSNRPFGNITRFRTLLLLELQINFLMAYGLGILGILVMVAGASTGQTVGSSCFSTVLGILVATAGVVEGQKVASSLTIPHLTSPKVRQLPLPASPAPPTSPLPMLAVSRCHNRCPSIQVCFF